MEIHHILQLTKTLMNYLFRKFKLKMNFFYFILLSLMIVSQSNSQVVRTHIGTTRYDLQTNSSIQRRLAVHPTSKNVIVTYTGSLKNDGAYNDRGTGYAFWNNASMQWSNSKNVVLTPPIDTFYGRIETVRVGWPNPMFIGNKELIISHKTDGGSIGIYKTSRSTAGTGTWADTNVTSGGEFWPRAASSGNNVFLISSHFNASFNGVNGGLMFIKSTDGGSIWSSPAAITGIDSNNYTILGGDRYALDINGNNVAILTGNNDITLYKSSNLGNTWTKKSIFPTTWNFIAGGEILDRADRSDGAYSVLIDNNNIAHCFWPRYVTFVDPSLGAGILTDITRSGIMYWNENMGNNPPKLLPNTDFLRENIAAPLSPLNRYNTATQTATYNDYRAASTAWPSSGIDTSGNIYLTYAYNRGIIDTTPANTGIGKDADPSGYNLYDVYVMKSTNNGQTWIGPLNVTNSATLENTFPSMARTVDSKIHMVYQEDNLYGNAVMVTLNGSSGTGSQAGPIHTRNKIFYAQVPVADIVNPATDITNPLLRISNNFQNLVARKGLTQLKAVLSIDCDTDSVTRQPFSKSKAFLSNYIEFSEDTSLLTVIGLDTINTSIPGNRLIRITGSDLAGNRTLRIGTTFYDTLIMGIEILSTSWISSTFTTSACGSYYWPAKNKTYTSSNNTDTVKLINAAGCDSIVTLNLTIKNSTSSTFTTSACDSYYWPAKNKTYTSSNNTDTVKLINAAGCDSIVTLNLTIKNSTSSTFTTSACDSYYWPAKNKTYTTSNNTDTVKLINAAGCDSIVTLNLTIRNAPSSSSTFTISACGSYYWPAKNKSYTTSNNTDTVKLINATGCDSIVTLNLTIRNAPSSSSTFTISACGSYYWATKNKSYTTSNNTDTVKLINVAGCDSIVTLNLTIKNATSSTFITSACGIYYWAAKNKTYTISNNTDTVKLINAVGCDSIVTLSLTIYPNPIPTIIKTGNVLSTQSYNSYQWLLNGVNIIGATTQSYTVAVSGNYQVAVTDTNNCSGASSIGAVIVSAVNNLKGQQLKIYPNPAKDHITIDYGVFGRMSGYNLKILNTLGQIVFSIPINQQTSYINLSTWTGKGMYLVQLFNPQNNLLENQKIVLQ